MTATPTPTRPSALSGRVITDGTGLSANTLAWLAGTADADLIVDTRPVRIWRIRAGTIVDGHGSMLAAVWAWTPGPAVPDPQPPVETADSLDDALDRFLGYTGRWVDRTGDTMLHQQACDLADCCRRHLWRERTSGR